MVEIILFLKAWRKHVGGDGHFILFQIFLPVKFKAYIWKISGFGTRGQATVSNRISCVDSFCLQN